MLYLMHQNLGSVYTRSLKDIYLSQSCFCQYENHFLRHGGFCFCVPDLQDPLKKSTDSGKKVSAKHGLPDSLHAIKVNFFVRLSVKMLHNVNNSWITCTSTGSRIRTCGKKIHF